MAKALKSENPVVVRLVTLAVASLVGLGLAELLAEAYVYRQDGVLTWVQPVGGTPAPVSVQALATDGDRLRLHPYYGFMALPGMRLQDVSKTDDMRRLYGDVFVDGPYARTTVDRDGFWSIHEADLPSSSTRDFVIGVFGGSVALQFALTMESTLARAIANAPVVAGRRVILKAYANGGTKQPQEVTALAYLLARGEHFDYVLNIDGFNELFIAWYNLHEHQTVADAPFARFINGIQNVAGASRQDSEREAATLRTRVTAWDLESRTSRLALHVMLAQALRERSRRELAALEERITKAPPQSVELAMPLRQATPDEQRTYAKDIADLWLRSSIEMRALADAYGIPYSHVLQPNQYFDNAQFTEEERRRHLDLKSPPLSELVPMVYGEYLRRENALAAAGVTFIDASHLFDGKGDVWIDDCCHFNERGNIQMAEFIATRIQRTSHAAPRTH